jgi:redox-sensitive bicupin YhaK (pirin superfamily)
MEGAGVWLRRAFGFGKTSDRSLLLFDDFRNERPEDYVAGLPWHPHRGIETITYVLSGTVSHGDSLGNQGTLGAGDVQWMTAGSGILHQEMPHGDTSGRMHGFQLWANLPSSLKMTDPRYQDVAGKDIPEITDDGTKVRWWQSSGKERADRRCRRRLAYRRSSAARHAQGTSGRDRRGTRWHVFDGEGRFRDASQPMRSRRMVSLMASTTRRCGARREPIAGAVRSGR